MKQLISGFYTLTGSLFLTILLFTIGLPWLIWYSIKLTYHMYMNQDKDTVSLTSKIYDAIPDDELPF